MSATAHSDPSTESQLFVQRRVAQFGRIAGFGGLFFWGFNVAGHVAMPEGRSLLDSGLVFHFLGATWMIAVWLICRGRPRSLRVVQTVETVGLLGSSISYGLMGTHFPVMVLRPDLIVLLAVNYGMTIRAILVPSTATRTLILTTLAGVSVIALNTVGAQREALSALQQFVPIPIPLVVTVESAVWWTLTTAVCTATSRILYGLRREVREARQLGQYLLEEKLGEGGMGVVYKAHHAMLRRPTAVKLLPPNKTGEGTLARFEREVRLTARLAHVNTVTVYDYGRTPEGVFYYAMELLEGANLGEVVDVGGALPPARVLHVLEQVAGSLNEAHGIGLIHRDIKPANVLLCEHAGVPDVAKVVDFGLVKDLEQGDVALTSDGTLTGTPLYMAPEAISAPETVDGRSDLYALGAVGYFLLTGVEVFTGRSVVEVCGHHLHTEPVPPSERTSRRVPADLEALLLSCLAKSPGERPQSAAELRGRVRACEDSGAWTDDAAREWWARHDDALAERRRGSARSASGQSLVIDFEHRESSRAPWDGASITGTAPGQRVVAKAKAKDIERGDHR